MTGSARPFVPFQVPPTPGLSEPIGLSASTLLTSGDWLAKGSLLMFSLTRTIGPSSPSGCSAFYGSMFSTSRPTLRIRTEPSSMGSVVQPSMSPLLDLSIFGTGPLSPWTLTVSCW